MYNSEKIKFKVKKVVKNTVDTVLGVVVSEELRNNHRIYRFLLQEPRGPIHLA